MGEFDCVAATVDDLGQSTTPENIVEFSLAVERPDGALLSFNVDPQRRVDAVIETRPARGIGDQGVVWAWDSANSREVPAQIMCEGTGRPIAHGVNTPAEFVSRDPRRQQVSVPAAWFGYQVQPHLALPRATSSSRVLLVSCQNPTLSFPVPICLLLFSQSYPILCTSIKTNR